MVALAMTFGLGAKSVMALWLALPWSLQTVIQGLITLAFGLVTLVARHFLRRYINRNWPDEARPQNEATGQARVNLFEFVRRRLRLRAASRQRTES